MKREKRFNAGSNGVLIVEPNLSKAIGPKSRYLRGTHRQDRDTGKRKGSTFIPELSRYSNME